MRTRRPRPNRAPTARTAPLHPAAARQLQAPLDARFPAIQPGDAISVCKSTKLHLLRSGSSAAGTGFGLRRPTDATLSVARWNTRHSERTAAASRGTAAAQLKQNAALGAIGLQAERAFQTTQSEFSVSLFAQMLACHVVEQVCLNGRRQRSERRGVHDGALLLRLVPQQSDEQVIEEASARLQR